MNQSQKSSFIGDGFDPSHNLNSYGHSAAWKRHYPQTHSSQVRSSAADRSYGQEQPSGIIQQPPSNAPRLPPVSVDNNIPMTDMDYSPVSNYSFSSGDAEMETSMNWVLSPLNNPSPSLSSDTTSSPSPLPSPNVAAQRPLKIHQPRPYRRIPIISLSQLASACDDIATKPSPKQTALSPLPFEYLDFNIEPPSAGVRQPYPYLSPTGLCNTYKSPTTLARTTDRTILCPCGCMGHYIYG